MNTYEIEACGAGGPSTSYDPSLIHASKFGKFCMDDNTFNRDNPWVEIKYGYYLISLETGHNQTGVRSYAYA